MLEDHHHDWSCSGLSKVLVAGEDLEDGASVADVALTDWCFSYGDSPSVWVITPIAW